MKRKNLLIWHIKNNLSHTDVCERLGYSKAHYSKILNGENDPSFEFMKRFGDNFGHLVDDIWELFQKE